MSRLVFFGAVLALVVLILFWDIRTIAGQVAKGAAIAYLVVAIVTFIAGLTFEWE